MPPSISSTALVTGAASGIGAACVDWLAAHGVTRFVLADRDKDRLDAIRPKGETVLLAGDVADPALWEAAADTGLIPDLAILNAGIAETAPIAELDWNDWRKVMSANLDGMFLSLRFAMRAMKKSGGSIVMTASASGFKAEPGTAAYGASKAGVIQLAKVAAKEGAPLGIRVNVIAPGGVDTPIWDGVPMFREFAEQQGSRERAIAAMGQLATPLGRYARADEIAAQIGFLLSDEAATITGAVLVSDGGYSL